MLCGILNSASSTLRKAESHTKVSAKFQVKVGNKMSSQRHRSSKYVGIDNFKTVTLGFFNARLVVGPKTKRYLLLCSKASNDDTKTHNTDVLVHRNS